MLAAELADTWLGDLEPLRVPLLGAAERMQLGSVAIAPSRVALAFGGACEASDASAEAVNGEVALARDRLGEQLWELGASCITARAILAALGSENERSAAAAVARGRLLEMGERCGLAGCCAAAFPPAPP